MARRHEEEENYWPGFVDALSTIVMVITLLMIILVIVIFTMTQMISETETDANGVGKPASTIAQTETGEKTKSENDAQSQTLSQSQSEQIVGTPTTEKSDIVKQEEIIEEENSLQIQSRNILDEKTVIVASEEQAEKEKEENKIEVKSAKQILTVLFSGPGIELNEEAKKEIEQYLEENRSVLQGQTLTTWSFYDPNSVALSQAKRIAYFRLLAVRNILINNGFTGENLTVNVRPAPSEEEVNKVLVFVK